MLSGNFIIQVGMINDKDTIKFSNSDVMSYKSLCEYEEEVGYTIEDLLNKGLSENEILEMQWKFDGHTGEKLDRKLRIEQAIKDKAESNTGKITMKSLIQEVLGVDQIRSGEVEKVDKIEQKESIKEEIKEGVSIDD